MSTINLSADEERARRVRKRFREIRRAQNAEAKRLLARIGTEPERMFCVEIIDAAAYLADFAASPARSMRLKAIARMDFSRGGDRLLRAGKKLRLRLLKTRYDFSMKRTPPRAAAAIVREVDKLRPSDPDEWHFWHDAIRRRASLVHNGDMTSPRAADWQVIRWLKERHFPHTLALPRSPIARAWAINNLLVRHFHGGMDDNTARAEARYLSVVFDGTFWPLERLADAGWIDEAELVKDFNYCAERGPDNQFDDARIREIREKWGYLLDQADTLAALGTASAWATTQGGETAAKGDQAAARGMAKEFRRRTAGLADAYKNDDHILIKTAAALEKHYERRTGQPAPFHPNMAAHSVIMRLGDPKFWTKRIRRVRREARVNTARWLGRIGSPDLGLEQYIVDEAVEEVHYLDERTLEFLKNSYRKGANGEPVSLYDLAMSGPVNERNRMIETFKRVEGIGKYCEEQGLVALFVVATLDSQWHRFRKPVYRTEWINGKRTKTLISQELNPIFNGASIKEANAELGRRWNIAQARMQHMDKAPGFRTPEAHAEGCPHWNLILFVKPEDIHQTKRIIWSEFLLKHNADEPGARRARLRFKEVRPTEEDPTVAQALVRYMAKYIFKGMQKDADDDAPARRTRHQAWASDAHIRTFQFFGTKPIGLYREMRRIGGGKPEILQLMLDQGVMDAWPKEFLSAHQAASGYKIERGFLGRSREIKMLETSDFGEYLSIVEALDIKLIKSDIDHRMDQLTAKEIEDRAKFCEAFHMNSNALGPGSYGQELPKRWSHFEITEGDSAHRIDVQARQDWLPCNDSGEDISRIPMFDHDLGIDAEIEDGERLPAFNFSGLLKLFLVTQGKEKANPRTMEFQRFMDKVYDFVPDERGRMTPVRRKIETPQPELTE